MTTPPATPPPNPIPPKLWSFFKEIFLNRSTLMGFLRRRKFSAFLYITNTILFVLSMLLLEINFDAQNRIAGYTIERKAMEADLNRTATIMAEHEQCRNTLEAAIAIRCNTPKVPPTPTTTRQAKPRRSDKKPPTSGIADKLNAIRDRNS